MKCKNILKEFYHSSYKNYRNLLCTLLKRAKENTRDIKKTWKGIKTLVSMKQKNNDTPSLIPKDEINDPLIHHILMIQSQLLILLITFLPLLLKLFTQKTNFQINHSEVFSHQKSIILSY